MLFTVRTGSIVEDEVTRVDAVRYLQGVTGHGILSTLFLAGAGLLAFLGRVGAGRLAVIVAYGIALNGVSIYAWNRLRDYFRSERTRAADPGSGRELTPHRLSPETRAQLIGGFVMAGGLVAFLLFVLGAIRWLGLEYAIPVLAAGLAVGNLGALGRAYYTATRR